MSGWGDGKRYIISEGSIDHDELVVALCANHARELVECKHCEKGTVLDECYVRCNLYKAIHAPTFYCADGRMRYSDD